jgi:anti-anti-sigma factor
MSAFQIETTDNATLVRLEGELTIEEARALQTALRVALCRPRELVIDPSALRRIDAAALQVLLAAAHAAPSARIAPVPAPVWAAAIERYALAAAFARN